MGCHFLLQGMEINSDPGIKLTSPCIGKGILYRATWEAPRELISLTNKTLVEIDKLNSAVKKWEKDINTKGNYTDKQ